MLITDGMQMYKFVGAYRRDILVQPWYINALPSSNRFLSLSVLVTVGSPAKLNAAGQRTNLNLYGFLLLLFCQYLL